MSKKRQRKSSNLPVHVSVKDTTDMVEDGLEKWFCETAFQQRSVHLSNLVKETKKKKKRPAHPAPPVEKVDGGWYYCKAIKGRRDYMEDHFAVQISPHLSKQPLAGSGSPLPQPVHASEIEETKSPTLKEERAFSFFGVFDGHGGTISSKYCREAFFSILRNHPKFPADISSALRDSFEFIDKVVCHQSQKVNDGTTATVAVIEHGKSAWIAHVGDSRAVMVKNDGTCLAATRDHSCTLEEECLRIKRDGGYVDKDCGDIPRVQSVLAITRAIGDRSLKPFVTGLPEISSFDLKSREFSYLCIATDGVWDEVSNQEAGKALIENGPKEGAREIISLAFNRGSEDNITCMAVSLQDSDHHFRMTGCKDELKTPVSSPASWKQMSATEISEAAEQNVPHIVTSSSSTSSGGKEEFGGSSKLSIKTTFEEMSVSLLAIAKEYKKKKKGRFANPSVWNRQVDGGWYFGKCIKGKRDYMEDNFAIAVPEHLRNETNTGTGSGLEEEEGLLSVEASRDKVEEEETKTQTHQLENYSFFGVYDGHGGAVSSEFCRERLFELIRNHEKFPMDMPTVLRESFQEIDEILCHESHRVHDGTTATVAVVEHGKNVWVANVGDSRCVLVKDDASFVAATRDHSCELEEECLRIETQGGFINRDGDIPRVQGVLAITRAIGDRSLKPFVSGSPEISHHNLEKDGFSYLCIASDGMWDEISNEEAAKILTSRGAKQAAVEMIALAYNRGSDDNITCLAANLSERLDSAN